MKLEELELELRYPKDKILFFSNGPTCMQCTMTERAFKALELQYHKIDMSDPEHPEHLEYVKSLGFHQAPVIITLERRWSGFNPDFFKEVARDEPQHIRA